MHRMDSVGLWFTGQDLALGVLIFVTAMIFWTRVLQCVNLWMCRCIGSNEGGKFGFGKSAQKTKKKREIQNLFWNEWNCKTWSLAASENVKSKAWHLKSKYTKQLDHWKQFVALRISSCVSVIMIISRINFMIYCRSCKLFKMSKFL